MISIRRVVLTAFVGLMVSIAVLSFVFAWTWVRERQQLASHSQQRIDHRPRFSKRPVPVTDDVGIAEDELVVGVVVGSTAVAYPVRLLAMTEHLNDHVAGKPVCASWCPRTCSAVVFDPRVGGQTLTFAVDHQFHLGNLVLADMKTRSLWSQMGAQSIGGELVGTKLAIYPSQQTLWRHWKQLHPQTLVSHVDKAEGRIHVYARQTPVIGDVSAGGGAERIEAHQLALGLHVSGESNVYPFSTLANVATPLADVLAGQTIQVHFDGDVPAAWATDGEGRLLAAITSKLDAWMRFHPEAKVYGQL